MSPTYKGDKLEYDHVNRMGGTPFNIVILDRTRRWVKMIDVRVSQTVGVSFGAYCRCARERLDDTHYRSNAELIKNSQPELSG